jgi:hypothetical protein
MATAPASIQPVRRTCPKCGYIRETTDTRCPDCGKTLQSVARIRALGVFSVILGVILLGVMGYLSWWMYNAITASTPAGGSPRFTGGPQEITFIIFVFGLVMVIGLVSLLGGLWQIIFGKRNKVLVYIIIGLGALFVLTGLAVSVAR